jgi:hypothetical protein
MSRRRYQRHDEARRHQRRPGLSSRSADPASVSGTVPGQPTRSTVGTRHPAPGPDSDVAFKLPGLNSESPTRSRPQLEALPTKSPTRPQLRVSPHLRSRLSFKFLCRCAGPALAPWRANKVTVPCGDGSAVLTFSPSLSLSRSPPSLPAPSPPVRACTALRPGRPHSPARVRVNRPANRPAQKPLPQRLLHAEAEKPQTRSQQVERGRSQRAGQVETGRPGEIPGRNWQARRYVLETSR